ncbi:MAG: CRTAC1 family protein [Phycisphaerae bacterium]
MAKRPTNKRHRLLIRWTVASGAVLVVVAVWALATRPAGESEVLPGERVEGLTAVLEHGGLTEAPPIRFEEVAARAGISFRHFPGQRGSVLPEDMGSGVALGDYDGDGLIDVFLVNWAGPLLEPLPQNREQSGCRLYRNLGDMRFEDVTESSGLDWIAYGMGAAWGDYDDDGDLDLYVTAYGDNALFANGGDGTFDEVTSIAGVNDPRFSAGCSWADYDRDGDLDLYVCNYVDFVYRERDRNIRKQQYSTEQPYTLNPSAYQPVGNALFQNRGDGTFVDVAQQAGVADVEGRSLSAAWVDMDHDGWPDLYVANDVSNNGVFRNLGRGTFEDIGPGSLAADYRGAMGIAAGDFDDDLDPDLMITHWIAQENALYRNMRFDAKVGDSKANKIWFMDAADECGLGQTALDMVGWATGFVDLDNDGRRDLWLVNGSTLEEVSDHSKLVPQRPFVFWQHQAEQFVDVAPTSGPQMTEPMVARGGAQADLDGDGLVDLVIVRHRGSPLVLRNLSSPTGHWVRLKLRQRGGNTWAIGAQAYLTAGGVTRLATVGIGPSYLSQHELTLHFGLGDLDAVETLRVVWPDGQEEPYDPPAVDRVTELTHRANYPVSLVRQRWAPRHPPGRRVGQKSPDEADGSRSENQRDEPARFNKP